MHELSTVSYVIRTVEDLCREKHVKHVEAVTLEVGEVSGIVPEFLADCWNWACSKSEFMTGTEMLVEPIAAVTVCETCEETYPTTKHGRVCPFCGGSDTYLLNGDQYNIKEVKVTF